MENLFINKLMKEMAIFFLALSLARSLVSFEKCNIETVSPSWRSLSINGIEQKVAQSRKTATKRVENKSQSERRLIKWMAFIRSHNLLFIKFYFNATHTMPIEGWKQKITNICDELSIRMYKSAWFQHKIHNRTFNILFYFFLASESPIVVVDRLCYLLFCKRILNLSAFHESTHPKEVSHFFFPLFCRVAFVVWYQPLTYACKTELTSNKWLQKRRRRSNA